MGFRKRLIITSTMDEETGTLHLHRPYWKMQRGMFVFAACIIAAFFCFGIWALLSGQDLSMGLWFTVFPVLGFAIFWTQSYIPLAITPTHLVCNHFLWTEEIPLSDIQWVNDMSYHGFTPFFGSWREHEMFILKVKSLTLKFLFIQAVPSAAGFGKLLQKRVQAIRHC